MTKKSIGSNWKLGIYGNEGALTAKQIELLATRFNLDRGQLGILSVRLGKLLHPDYPAFGLDEPMRKIEKGPKELQKGLTNLYRAKRSLTKALEYFDKVTMLDPHGREGAENPYFVFCEDLRSAYDVISRTHQLFRNNAERRTSVFNNTADHRMDRDVHRGHICYALFDFWQKSGKKLSFTTDPVTSERQGVLFEFVNAVTDCLTDPATTINGHTIYDEFQAFELLQSASIAQTAR